MFVFLKSFYKVSVTSTKMAVGYFGKFDKFTVNFKWKDNSSLKMGGALPVSYGNTFMGIGAGLDY